MEFNTPAFGSVCRRWAEQILALWTGEAEGKADARRSKRGQGLLDQLPVIGTADPE